jgi:hypothetical protein
MDSLLSLKVPGSEGSVEIQVPSGVPTGGLSGGGGKIIVLGLTLFLMAAVLLSLGFLLYGGLNWIMSQGDKAKLESARRTVLFAIIGLIICFSSFFLIQFMSTIFGVNLLNLSL